VIEIKNIDPTQSAELAELQAETFRQAYADVHTPENIDTYCATHYTAARAHDTLSSTDTVCCFGYLGAQLSGYYIIQHTPCPIQLGYESSELKQIYVLSSAYGSGLGQSLYEHAIGAIAAAGRRYVWLSVSDANDRAKAFYAKLGFSIAGEGPTFIVGEDRLSSSILVRDI